MSPVWGSYSMLITAKTGFGKVCPPCGGVILRLLNFEQKKSNLSPMWGSYSYPATMIPKLPEFVLHVGELFCYFNFSLILNSSLSPREGELFCVIWITRKNISLSPARGSYSDSGNSIREIAEFVSHAGSYS